GPPTLPIIGNLHQIPKTNVHLQYQKWAQQYGPIFSLKLGQSTTIVLADGEVIRDLVDQRGANYADRPKLWVRELFDDSRIIMRGYDDLWRTERKLYHSQLNISVARKYLPYQELETLQMLTQIAEDPANFVQYLGRMTGSMATSIAYGFRLPKTTDPLTHEMLENSHGFFQCVVRSAVLDWFPSLKPLVSLIPRHINPWATEALAAYTNERKTFEKAYKMGLRSRLPCFTTDIEAAKTNMKLLSDHAAVYIAGIAFEGGADTTRYTLQGLFKAMALFPEAQKKAQAELDEVVGATELPSSKHLENLKYINCTAKECVRWMPTAINGAIPHATVHDDQYRGYRIPAGATVVLAVWSASHDPKNFDDARTFRPERQNPDTTIYEATNIASPKERGLYGFGAGRRICPGMHVAHNTLMLAIARILWAFNIAPAEDEAGNPVTIDRDAVAGGLAAMPAPFKCKIIPRSEKRAALISKEWSALSAKCLDEEGNYKQSMFDTK
ncbi:cytochrome P450, partial [Paraphoma chrysanthemicola]